MVCAGATTSVTIASVGDAATGCYTLHTGDGEVQFFLLESVGSVSTGEKLSSHYYVISCSVEELNQRHPLFYRFINFAVRTTHKVIGIEW